jgi:hypothetical protein
VTHRVKRFLRGRRTDWPRTLRYGAGAAVVLVTSGALLWTRRDVWMGSDFLEPFAWFEGVSLWPTQHRSHSKRLCVLHSCL